MNVNDLWNEMNKSSSNKSNTSKTIQLLNKKRLNNTSVKINKPVQFIMPKSNVVSSIEKSKQVEDDNELFTVLIVQFSSIQEEEAEKQAAHILKFIQREINQISDNNFIVRKKSLTTLNRCLFSEQSKEKLKFADEMMCELFPHFLKPLLKRFADPVEICREIALNMILSFLPIISDLGLCLPYMIPAIMDRIPNGFEYDDEMKMFIQDKESHLAMKRGKAIEKSAQTFTHTVVEPSEELRLKLTEIIFKLFEVAGGLGSSFLLNPYILDISLCLASAVNDPYPEVKKTGCNALILMCHVHQEAAKALSVAFIRAVMPCLNHRHAKVRLSAIDAIDALVTVEDKAKCKGAGTEAIIDLVGFKESNVLSVASFYVNEVTLNYFAYLVKDNNPSVRYAFIKMVANWMITLPDRWDHHSRLIAYLLSALHDSNLDIAHLALDSIDKLGSMYEEEHKDKIIEKKQYGIEGALHIIIDGPFPEPHLKRPRVGARQFVHDHVRRFLKPLLEELASWKSKNRLDASMLLVNVLVYMEEHSTVHAQELISAIFRNFNDSEISSKIIESAKLCGRYLPPETYTGMLLPRIRLDDDVGLNTSSARCLAIKILLLMIAESKISFILPQLPAIINALSAQDIITTIDSDLRRIVCEFLNFIINTLIKVGPSAFSGSIFKASGRLPDMNTNIIYKMMKSFLRSSQDKEQISNFLVSLSQFAELKDPSELILKFKKEIDIDSLNDDIEKLGVF